MLLNDVINEYIFEIRLRNYSERTIKAYRNNILKFARYIESELELKNYLNYLKLKGPTEVI